MADATAGRPTPVEKLEWRPLFGTVGLDSDEKIERLNRILVVHLLIDRLLTLLVAAKLLACSRAKGAPDVEKVIADVAPLPIPKRTELALALCVVDPAIGEKILEVNQVRNRLVHFKPKKGTSAWAVDQVEEIASPEASSRCVQNGIDATQALMSALKEDADGETR